MMLLELKSRTCPVCSSPGHDIIGRPRKVDDLFKSLNNPDLSSVRIVRCRRCSLLYTDPFPYFSDELLRKMYSNENNYFPELTPKMERVIHHENPLRRFQTAERHAKRPIQNYLEIGCGQGFGLKTARAKGWKISGQDVSPDFARIVKDHTGIDILIGTVKHDSFPSGAFDCIYVDSVLEHVPDPVEYMSFLYGFLAPGGVIYLTLPNEGSFQNICMDHVLALTGSNATSRTMPFFEPYHTMGFTKKSIVFLGEKIGLSIPFLECRYSYGHCERFKRPLTFLRTFKRISLAPFHVLADILNIGMNMEVVFVKKDA